MAHCLEDIFSYRPSICIWGQTILVFVPRRGIEGGADCTISANFPQPWALEYQYGNQICISDVFSGCISPVKVVEGAYLMFAFLLSEAFRLRSFSVIEIYGFRYIKSKDLDILYLNIYIWIYSSGLTNVLLTSVHSMLDLLWSSIYFLFLHSRKRFLFLHQIRCRRKQDSQNNCSGSDRVPSVSLQRQ